MMQRTILLLLFSLFLTGCVSQETIATGTPVLSTPEKIKIEDPSPLPVTLQPIQLPTTEELQMTPPALPPSPSDLLSGLIEQAKQDLAQRLSIAVSGVNLIQAREVVWPDSSLGCPQPGMMYMMVLTPGYLIILNVENRDYEYHAGKGLQVIYCQNPSPPVPGEPADS